MSKILIDGHNTLTIFFQVEYIYKNEDIISQINHEFFL